MPIFMVLDHILKKFSKYNSVVTEMKQSFLGEGPVAIMGELVIVEEDYLLATLTGTCRPPT